MPDWLVILISAFIGALPGIYTQVVGARKIKADAPSAVTSAALSLIQPQTDRITRLENENEKLRSDVAELKIENHVLFQRVEEFSRVLTGAHILYQQVLDANQTPAYTPPERRKGTGELRQESVQ